MFWLFSLCMWNRVWRVINYYLSAFSFSTPEVALSLSLSLSLRFARAPSLPLLRVPTWTRRANQVHSSFIQMQTATKHPVRVNTGWLLMIEGTLLSLFLFRTYAIGNSADSISFQHLSFVFPLLRRSSRELTRLADEQTIRNRCRSSNREIFMQTDMSYRGNSIVTTHQRQNRQRLTSPFKFLLEILTHYESKIALHVFRSARDLSQKKRSWSWAASYTILLVNRKTWLSKHNAVGRIVWNLLWSIIVISFWWEAKIRL